MNLRLSKGQLHSASIEAISSKSFVHRLLIAAALSDSSVTIDTNIISKDMEATVGVLRALGASIDVYEDKFVVNSPVSGIVTTEGATTESAFVESATTQTTVNLDVTLDCIESGSTARFILPLAVQLSKSVHMIGSGKLPERPFTELVEVLNAHGATIDSTHLPLTASGELIPGNYEIAGNVSSQYISGLLFVLPLLDGPSTLTITTNLESSGYVDMTLDVLKTFGIVVNRADNVFTIPGGQRYHGPSHIKAEGDWSNGAYLMAFAKAANMLDSEIEIAITGLKEDSLQKDRAIKKVIDDITHNSETKLDNNSEAELDNNSETDEDLVLDYDCSEIPDIVPAIAVLLTLVKGRSYLRNIERLRIKESDRIASTCELLKILNVQYEVISENNHESLAIDGVGLDLINTLKNDIIIDSFNDHRVVMAAAIIALFSSNGVVINNAYAINKSYPGFFEMLKSKLGMQITEI